MNQKETFHGTTQHNTTVGIIAVMHHHYEHHRQYSKFVAITAVQCTTLRHGTPELHDCHYTNIQTLES